MTAIFILLFEVLKRKAQIIESNIFMLAAIFNYSVFVNRIQSVHKTDGAKAKGG